MNENPYRTALFAIGMLGLIIAVVLFINGSNAGIDGIGMLAFAGALFPVAGFAFVAWLLTGALQWNQPADSPVIVRD